MQVNSLSFAPADSGSGAIYFDGPYDAPSVTLPALTAVERMQVLL